MTSNRALWIAAIPIIVVEAAAVYGCWQIARALWGWRGVRT